MAHNFNPVGGQGKAILQNLQSKRQKMEHNITRQQSAPLGSSTTPSLVAPLTRSQLLPSFTNNPQPAPKPKLMKGPEDKPTRFQMNEAITLAERTSSGYYVGNPSPFGNLLIPVIPRLDPPKDREFKETKLPRDA